MFSWICAWTYDCVNNREAGDLRRHCAHYDVTAIEIIILVLYHSCKSLPLIWISDFKEWNYWWVFQYEDAFSLVVTINKDKTSQDGLIFITRILYLGKIIFVLKRCPSPDLKYKCLLSNKISMLKCPLNIAARTMCHNDSVSLLIGTARLPARIYPSFATGH